MAIDFVQQVYNPAFGVFARPVIFYPIKSQPNVPSFGGRGIYSTQPMDVEAEALGLYSDQRTILDVIGQEFSVPLVQEDRLNIPADGTLPALGDFEVIDIDDNGGGELTLSIRKILVAKP